MKYFLGLGSNMGDRLAYLRGAVESLGARGVKVVGCSSVYESDAVGGPEGQDKFLNAVIEVDSTLGPYEMLALCADLEAEAGRVRDERWGPRTLDVDILLWDGEPISDDLLEIPHPRMSERGFVMLPLAEIDPDRRVSPELATSAWIVGTLI